MADPSDCSEIDVLSSSQLVSSRSRHVTLKPGMVTRLAEQIVSDVVSNGSKSMLMSVRDWKSQGCHPREANKAAVDWIFIVDTLNFSFWTDDDQPQFVVTHGAGSWTGYWALCACINRALENNIPITDATFCENVTEQRLSEILAGDGGVSMPLMAERVECLNEVGRVLNERFGGSFVNVVKQCNGSATKLLNLIVQNFPCYRDFSNFDGNRVWILKRAQILVADVWACFEGKDIAHFSDIDAITMFADYRVPQVLLHFGILNYSDVLLERLMSKKLFVNGDPAEVEIRAASIVATEMLVTAVRREMTAQSAATGRTPLDVNAILIDNYLWTYRRAHRDECDKVPFHRVRSIYY